MPTFRAWWSLDPSSTGLADCRGDRRVTEVDDQRYAGESHRLEAGVVDGRFTIATQRWQNRWVAIVEPDVEASLLVVVTVYEVPQ